MRNVSECLYSLRAWLKRCLVVFAISINAGIKVCYVT